MSLLDIDASKIMKRPTRVFFLKMVERPQSMIFDRDEVAFLELDKPITVNEYLQYYGAVGINHNWLDRLLMPKEDLHSLINADNVRIYVMRVRSEDAGYLELIVQPNHVELLYFGLLPGFVGKGYGKYFLQWSTDKAWSFNPDWVQLNTCELDHPNALPIYRKMGFVDYKTIVEERRIMVEG